MNSQTYVSDHADQTVSSHQTRKSHGKLNTLAMNNPRSYSLRWFATWLTFFSSVPMFLEQLLAPDTGPSYFLYLRTNLDQIHRRILHKKPKYQQLVMFIQFSTLWPVCMQRSFQCVHNVGKGDKHFQDRFAIDLSFRVSSNQLLGLS